jgi:tetratricopeptide (TPR) repeat protein
MGSCHDGFLSLVSFSLPESFRISSKCIITSREWVDVADMLRLTGLPLEEAEYLIIEEATAREVKVSKAEQKQLFKYTSGLPLPIKLSIARMGSGETLDQVSRWLGNAKGDLPDYCVKGQIDTARQCNLNAWKLLLACSRFDREAGASREALGFVADLSLTDRDDGLTLLQRLSLLHQMENGRFRMLPMVQGYAGVELTRADFGELLTERWLDWLLAFTQRYSFNLDFHIEKTHIVHSEYPNLLNSIRWCYEHKQWKILLQLAEGTWFYPFLVGLFNELKEILEAAVEAARALNDEQCEGRFFIQLGRLCWKQGQYEKALVEYLKKAEEIALQYKNDADLGQIYHIRSAVLSEQGHLSEAEQVISNTLEIGERLNDLELKFYASYRLSKFEAKKRHFSKGLKWVDQGETWSKELGWSRGLAWITYRRGDILIQQGNVMAAEPFLMQSLTMASSWNERHLIAQIKYYLALVYSNTHRLQLARQMAEEAYDLCDRLGMTKELVQAGKLLQTFLK